MPKLNPNDIVILKAIGGPKAVYSIAKHPGLYLAATGRDAASWRIKYRPRGAANQRWHTITNDARSIKFREVAEKARELLTALRLDGTDPKAEFERPAGMTFDVLFNDWLERHAKVKKRSWLNDEQMYHRHIAERLGSKVVAEIGRREVIATLGEIARVASGIQANRAQALISAVFTWAVAMELATAHPAMKIPKFGTETARERIWTQDELRKLWHALAGIIAGDDQGPVSPQMARLILVLLLTGQRRSEVAHMAVAEIAGDVWSIPAGRMKGKRAHAVPLGSMAAMALADAVRHGEPAGYVFPGRSGGKLDPLSVGKALDRLTGLLKIEGAKIHDLRRTMASTMGKLGIAEGTISRVLAHTQSSITATHYNLHSYDAEKRAAFAAWEAELVRIAAG